MNQNLSFSLDLESLPVKIWISLFFFIAKMTYLFLFTEITYPSYIYYICIYMHTFFFLHYT